MNARRLVLATLATLCTTAGGLFAGAAAQAELAHSFLRSFGPAGMGSGAFSDPRGVAVDRSTGDVYVYDVKYVESRGVNEVFVYKFNSLGEPVTFAALGSNVIEGSGEAYTENTEIAVDSSGGPTKGDIYVTEGEHVAIYGSDGNKLGELNSEVASSGAPWSTPCGVAVDPAGNVYVGLYEGDVNKYKAPVGNPLSNGDYVSSMAGVGYGSCSLAADSEGNVYLDTSPEGPVTKYEALQFGSPAASGTVVDLRGRTLAVDPSISGDLYIDEGSDVAQYDSSGNLLGKFGAAGSGTLNGGSFGVAVNHSSGELYVANGNGEEGGKGEVNIYGPGVVVPDVITGAASGVTPATATLNGTVNPDGVPVSSCGFEYGTTVAYGQTEPCTQTPAQIGGAGSSVPVSANLTGLQPGSTYHYRLDAGNASGTNKGQDQTLTTPGPSIDGESASNVTSTSVTLQAQINPNGQDTTYYFQYGTSSSYDVSVPVAPGADIGSGSSDQAASQAISGLQPSTSYHYRVVAVNVLATHYGPDQVFGTNATPAAPPSYSSSPGLPDGRVYEQASPADKNGNGAGSGSGVATVGGSEDQYSVASPDGNAILFYGTGAMGNASSGLAGYFVARRSAAGWTTTEATPRPTSGRISAFSSLEVILSSSDLSRVAFGQPASLGGFAGAATGNQLYLAGLDPLAQPAWLSQPTIPAPVGGSVLWPAGASSDLSAVYFGYNGTLLPQDASRTPYAGRTYEEASMAAATGFYEWKNGVLMPAGLLPDGSTDPFGAVPAAEAMAYHENGTLVTAEDLNNQVSTDGSHAFFVSPDPYFCSRLSSVCGGDEPELYASVTAADGTQSTVLVSKSAITGQAAPHGPLQIQNPHRALTPFGFSSLGRSQPYVYASPDGSQAFFESTDQLTSDAPNDSSVKAYDFNVTTGSLMYLPGVADLPPESAPAQISGPLGTSPILTSSQDGSDFIFVKYPASGPPQLDLWRSGSSDGTVTPISQLPPSPAHEMAYSENNRFQTSINPAVLGDMAFVGARATADGSVFMFETDSPLPGFNNAPGYEEIYRYDAVANTLSCISCPPAGVTPSGDAQFSHSDLIQSFSGLSGWLNAARGMSADGSRIFFDTPDPLVPQATNGVRDVYEWENGRIYLLSSGTSVKDSLILDSSASGDDVFFATTDGLVAGDTDGAYDVYDARVPHPGDVPPSSAVPCQGDVCQGPPRVPSLLGISPSETFSGPGNPVPPPAAKAVTHKQVKKKPKKARKHKKKRKKASTRSKGGRK